MHRHNCGQHTKDSQQHTLLVTDVRPQLQALGTTVGPTRTHQGSAGTLNPTSRLSSHRGRHTPPPLPPPPPCIPEPPAATPLRAHCCSCRPLPPQQPSPNSATPYTQSRTPAGSNRPKTLSNPLGCRGCMLRFSAAACTSAGVFHIPFSGCSPSCCCC